MQNQLTRLLNIRLPIIQGGMVWCSGWKLVHAVCEQGALGVLGSGSMYPEILEEHIVKLQQHQTYNFAVNLPLLYPQIGEHIRIIQQYKVPIVITSAGNPATYTQQLKNMGCMVLHVVANTKFALKALEAGVDGLIVEGTEAGGHNGREEMTTLTLFPEIRKLTQKPVVAAGGIGSGKAMFALMAMGADGVQVGSRFAVSSESSAHINYKNAVIQSQMGDTVLTLKEITPVRLLKNQFYHQVAQAYQNNQSLEEIKSLLGKGRAKKGIFEGNLEEGELEIGQVAAGITQLQTVEEIINEFKNDYQMAYNQMMHLNWK
jgi:enoyl-[acyl-carrier protein] reductase II